MPFMITFWSLALPSTLAEAAVTHLSLHISPFFPTEMDLSVMSAQR